MTAIRCTCQGLPMGPGQECRAHQMPPSGDTKVQLVFRMEVEVSGNSPEQIRAVVEDIDSQVSGLYRETRIRVNGVWHYVDYQVMAMHGERTNGS